MSFFSGASTTNTTQTSKGSAEQEAQLKQYFDQLQQFGQQGPQQYFQGNTVAGLAPEQLQAQQAAMQFAQGGAQDIYGQLQTAGQTGQNMMGMAGQDPMSQPGFAGMLDYLQTRTNQNLNENILPELRGQSQANNMFGGSRGAIAAGLAGGRAQEGLTGTMAGMLNQGWNQNNSNALQAMGMAPGLAGAQASAGMLPAEIMAAVGGQNQAMDQSLINAAMDRWNFEQAAPGQHLAQQQALQGTVGQYGGTTHTKQKTSTPFGFNQLVGLAGTAAGAMSGLGGLGALMGGAGAAGAGASLPGITSGVMPNGSGGFNIAPSSIWSNANFMGK
jgi:hypothetical protein